MALFYLFTFLNAFYKPVDPRADRKRSDRAYVVPGLHLTSFFGGSYQYRDHDGMQLTTAYQLNHYVEQPPLGKVRYCMLVAIRACGVSRVPGRV